MATPTFGDTQYAGFWVAMPDSSGWLCGSTNPGISTVLPRSVTSTPGAAACTSETEPMAVIRPVPVSIATARARGTASSIVMMLAALRIRSVAIGPFLPDRRSARGVAPPAETVHVFAHVLSDLEIGR